MGNIEINMQVQNISPNIFIGAFILPLNKADINFYGGSTMYITINIHSINEGLFIALCIIVWWWYKNR